MTSRKRFCIPSESDIKESTNDQDKQFSKFKSFKLNKDPDEKSVDIPRISAPPPTSTVSSIPTAKRLGTSSTAIETKSNTTSKSSSVPNYPKSNTLSTSHSASDTKSDMPSSLSTVPHQSAQSIQSTSKPASSNSIIVNFRQRGNPVLKHIRNVPWEYGSIIPDYVMGVANCALYLSLRYHQLHPDYLHNRLKELGKGYDLRVLLVQVDVKEPHTLLKDLAKICILADMTLVLAFSQEEVGRYLEAYKVFENKPEEALMEKSDTDFGSKLTECLTTVKSVNKTDCMTLLTAFKSMNGIINASKQDIGCCGGFGPQKAQRLYDVFHEPFVQSRKSLK